MLQHMTKQARQSKNTGEYATRAPSQDALITLSGEFHYGMDLKSDQMEVTIVGSPIGGIIASISPALKTGIREKLETYGYVIVNNCPHYDEAAFENQVENTGDFLLKMDFFRVKIETDYPHISAQEKEEAIKIAEETFKEDYSPSVEKMNWEKGNLSLLMWEAIGRVLKIDNEGALYNDEISLIKPDKKILLDERSYKSSNSLGLHTDLSYLKKGDEPKYIGLYFSQNDLFREAQSQFAHIDDAVPLLSSQTIDELLKAQFYFQEPRRAGHKDKKKFSIKNIFESLKERPVKKSILTPEGDHYDVCFRQNIIKAPTKKGQRAVCELAQAFKEVRFGYRPQPGTAIIAHNKKVVHDRTDFEPTFDDDDRYVFRAYVNEMDMD